MPVTAYWYTNAFVTAFNKEYSWASGTIKVQLNKSTYAVAKNTDKYLTAATASEVGAGTGYVAGGTNVLTGATYGGSLSYASGTTGVGTVTFRSTATSVTWPTATISSARYAVIYEAFGGTAASAPLIAYVDFGGDQSSAGGDFQIVWNTSGIATVVTS